MSAGATRVVWNETGFRFKRDLVLLCQKLFNASEKRKQEVGAGGATMKFMSTKLAKFGKKGVVVAGDLARELELQFGFREADELMESICRYVAPNENNGNETLIGWASFLEVLRQNTRHVEGDWHSLRLVEMEEEQSLLSKLNELITRRYFKTRVLDEQSSTSYAAIKDIHALGTTLTVDELALLSNYTNALWPRLQEQHCSPADLAVDLRTLKEQLERLTGAVGKKRQRNRINQQANAAKKKRLNHPNNRGDGEDDEESDEGEADSEPTGHTITTNMRPPDLVMRSDIFGSPQYPRYGGANDLLNAAQMNTASNIMNRAAMRPPLMTDTSAMNGLFATVNRKPTLPTLLTSDAIITRDLPQTILKFGAAGVSFRKQQHLIRLGDVPNVLMPPMFRGRESEVVAMRVLWHEPILGAPNALGVLVQQDDVLKGSPSFCVAGASAVRKSEPFSQLWYSVPLTICDPIHGYAPVTSAVEITFVVAQGPPSYLDRWTERLTTGTVVSNDMDLASLLQVYSKCSGLFTAHAFLTDQHLLRVKDELSGASLAATLLQVCAYYGIVTALTEMLQRFGKMIDISELNNTGLSALAYAAKSCSPFAGSISRLLLSCGAAPRSMDPSKDPWSLACVWHNDEVLDAVEAFGGRVYMQSNPPTISTLAAVMGAALTPSAPWMNHDAMNDAMSHNKRQHPIGELRPTLGAASSTSQMNGTAFETHKPNRVVNGKQPRTHNMDTSAHIAKAKAEAAAPMDAEPVVMKEKERSPTIIAVSAKAMGPSAADIAAEAKIRSAENSDNASGPSEPTKRSSPTGSPSSKGKAQSPTSLKLLLDAIERTSPKLESAGSPKGNGKPAGSPDSNSSRSSCAAITEQPMIGAPALGKVA